MPTRLLLEGSEIEPLLEQIRDEYGAAARIVSADKVRSGGLGGFFARQRYEVSVEVLDETPEPEVSAQSDAPSSSAAAREAATCRGW